MVRMPLRVAIMGPIVDPQPESDRTVNSCVGQPAILAHSRKMAEEMLLVAYLWGEEDSLLIVM